MGTRKSMTLSQQRSTLTQEQLGIQAEQYSVCINSFYDDLIPLEYYFIEIDRQTRNRFKHI